jgi:diaminopimelate decarboxylase
MTRKQLQQIARQEGTPVVVIDHNAVRANYRAFHQHLPRVQAYYAVKANPAPAIVRSLYKIGASFDVASLAEFMLVYENIKHLPPKSSRISSGTRSFTPIPPSRAKRWRRWINTSRWSRSTTSTS